MIRHLKIGNKIIISRVSVGDTDTSYMSQVENILKNKELVVSVPISYGSLIRLPTKIKYKMVFHTERGTEPIMILFEGTILSYFKEGNVYLMKIRLTSNGEIIQRREFFRFTCQIPVKISMLNYLAEHEYVRESEPEEESETETGNETESETENETEAESEPGVFKGVTRDISGGGIRFVSDADIDENEEMDFFLELDDEDFEATGRILQKQFLTNSNFKYQYRAEYTKMLKKDQEKIVRYIFNKQRQQLKVSK